MNGARLESPIVWRLENSEIVVDEQILVVLYMNLTKFCIDIGSASFKAFEVLQV